MPLSLSTKQTQLIAARIQPDLSSFVRAFDLKKYPDSAYRKLLVDFKSPKGANKAAISDALRWKFGHWNKSNYPNAHKALIDRVAAKWPTLTPQELKTPSQLFAALNGDFRFITASFLTHLVHPSAVAIIDQHNFRSLGHFMRFIDPKWKHKAAPSTYQDLLDVSYFLTAVVNANALRLNNATATLRDVDMFLMAHGKSLKPRRTSAA